MSGPARYRLGRLSLHVLSDGQYYVDAGAAFGVVPRMMWERYAAADLDDHHRIPLGLNCLYLESQGKRILIETGVGDKNGARRQSTPAADRNLIADLARIGVRPVDVDVVINTHLHADHCGWNTRLVGEQVVPTFANARYYIQRGEWEAACHPNERTRATYLADNLTPLEDAGVLALVDGEQKVTDEVTIIPTPGHTADHASVVITSGRQMALYVGDIAQHRVQLERNAWVSAFDVLPLMSIETKKRLMERAMRERALVIAVHLAFPGVGRMEATAEGRRQWVAVAPVAVAT